MNRTELEAGFAGRGVRRGDVLLLGPADALELVDKARSCGLKVLGVDSFQVIEAATIPLEMADFSDVTEESSWDRARDFIHAERKATHFDVVIATDEPPTLLQRKTTREFYFQLLFLVVLFALGGFLYCWGG